MVMGMVAWCLCAGWGKQDGRHCSLREQFETNSTLITCMAAGPGNLFLFQLASSPPSTHRPSSALPPQCNLRATPLTCSALHRALDEGCARGSQRGLLSPVLACGHANALQQQNTSAGAKE